ncbi:hypothetical protein E4U23_001685 [Claviceps purpurea]|nr:hypothetical protein E4U23_001685 [Claviceps purpurea]
MAPLTRLVPMEAIHASSLNGQFGSALVTGPDFDDNSDISTFWTYGVPTRPSAIPHSLRDTTTVIFPAALRTRNLLLRTPALLYPVLGTTVPIALTHNISLLHLFHREPLCEIAILRAGSQPTLRAVSCFFAPFQLCGTGEEGSRPIHSNRTRPASQPPQSHLTVTLRCPSNGGLLYSRLSAALIRDATAYSSSHATITLQTRHRDLDIQAGVVKLGSRLLELRKRPACGFSPPTTILSREPDVE